MSLISSARLPKIASLSLVGSNTCRWRSQSPSFSFSAIVERYPFVVPNLQGRSPLLIFQPHLDQMEHRSIFVLFNIRHLSSFVDEFREDSVNLCTKFGSINVRCRIHN